MKSWEWCKTIKVVIKLIPMTVANFKNKVWIFSVCVKFCQKVAYQKSAPYVDWKWVKSFAGWVGGRQGSRIFILSNTKDFLLLFDQFSVNTLDSVWYVSDILSNSYLTFCPKVVGQWHCHKMPDILSTKSHFVQQIVFCSAPTVPAVPTFWTPGGR